MAGELDIKLQEYIFAGSSQQQSPNTLSMQVIKPLGKRELTNPNGPEDFKFAHDMPY